MSTYPKNNNTSDPLVAITPLSHLMAGDANLNNLGHLSNTTQLYNKMNDTTQAIPNGPSAEQTQPLTQFHSKVYRLLTWESPKTTTTVYATIVSAILAFRYVDLLGYSLGLTCLILAAVSVAEVAFGFATRLHPGRYRTLSTASLHRFTTDLEQFINFVVIEFQRILLVENLPVTLLASASAGLGWILIKLLPFWGLSFLATNAIFLSTPLYFKNKQFIDEHLKIAVQTVAERKDQVIDLATQHTNQAAQAVKGLAQEYSQSASHLISDLSNKSTHGSTVSSPTNRSSHVNPQSQATSAGELNKIPVKVQAVTPIQPIRVKEPAF